nr:hypothetical protein [Candidatus Peribacteraceae bacterium]
ELREMLGQAAALAGQESMSIEEYQLFEDERIVGVMSRQRQRQARENDVLLAIDPTPSQDAFVGTLMEHPSQRTVTVWTDAQACRNIAAITNSQRLPMLGSHGTAGIEHIFRMHMSANGDEAAMNYGANVGVLEKSLRYPNIPPVAHDMASALITDTEVTLSRYQQFPPLN